MGRNPEDGSFTSLDEWLRNSQDRQDRLILFKEAEGWLQQNQTEIGLEMDIMQIACSMS